MDKEIVIPAGKGGAFTVRKGQRCRITALEGEQCLDAVFLNAADHRERFHAWFSYSFNCKLGTGNAFHCKTLFSGPPWERPMLTVLEDTVKQHFVLCSGRCSPMIYRLRDGVEGHASCQQNLAEALAPYGIGQHEVPDVFNMFMHAGVGADGLIYIPAEVEEGRLHGAARRDGRAVRDLGLPGRQVGLQQPQAQAGRRQALLAEMKKLLQRTA